MARAATTSDVFNAVAEARRRAILDLLAQGDLPVNELVARLGLTQPRCPSICACCATSAWSTSENRDASGYRLNGRALEPIHDWLAAYEGAWRERLDRLDTVLEDLKESEKDDGSGQ